jgi:hypothetical protein
LLPDLALRLEVGLCVLLTFLENFMTPKVNPNGSAPFFRPSGPVVAGPGSNSGFTRTEMDLEQWKAILAHIDEPATARLVVDLFRTHTHLQASYPAVFLRAMRCMERADKSAATAKAAGRAVKLVGATCASALALVFRSALQGVVWVHARIRKEEAAAPQADSDAELVWPTLDKPLV